ESLRRAFLYLIAFHVPIIGLAVLAPLIGLPPLLLPIHLVWLEMIVHPVSALVFEGGRTPHAMRRPPRNPRLPLLGRGALTLSLVSGSLITASALWLYARGQATGAAGARSE